MCNLKSFESTSEKVGGAIAKMVGTTEFFIPLTGSVDKEEETRKIEADIKYYEGFRASVMKKLSNESFVSKAPSNIVEAERKKLSDSEQKIALLKEQLAALK